MYLYRFPIESVFLFDKESTSEIRIVMESAAHLSEFARHDIVFPLRVSDSEKMKLSMEMKTYFKDKSIGFDAVPIHDEDLHVNMPDKLTLFGCSRAFLAGVLVLYDMPISRETAQNIANVIDMIYGLKHSKYTICFQKNSIFHSHPHVAILSSSRMLPFLFPNGMFSLSGRPNSLSSILSIMKENAKHEKSYVEVLKRKL